MKISPDRFTIRADKTGKILREISVDRSHMLCGVAKRRKKNLLLCYLLIYNLGQVT